jgi:hypothetical protein
MNIHKDSKYERHFSSKAGSCDNQGNSSGARRSKIINAQRTSKPLKAQLFLSVSLFWIGLLSWFLPHGHSSEVLGISWAAAATIAGGVWYVITKVMIWWEHA